MRRTHRRVREEGKQFYIAWLVEKGQVSVSGANGTRTVAAGSIMLTNASDASYIEAVIGKDGEHRDKMALVPAHLLHRHLPRHAPLNTMAFPATGVDGTIVASLINLLFATGDEMSREDAAAMLELLLGALARLIAGETDHGLERRSMQQLRLAQVRSNIELQMANPRLSLAEVARMCGISPRYLAQVMRASGTSFATMLREKRLAEACRWLSTADQHHHTIAEVAEMVGFSSAAQLSRTFHVHYGCTPRQFRARTLGPAGDD